MSAPLEVARDAWGDDLPDWVERLAEECGRTSQNKVAQKLGRSAALVSNVLRRKYGGSNGGDMASVEDLVRGRFMAHVTNCPALGEIGTHICRGWRSKASTFSGHNAQSVTMFRACKRCPVNAPGKAGQAEDAT